MASIVRATVPAAEFALQETLSQLPHVEFEMERIVESGENTVLPLMWIRGTDPDTVRAACADDPSVDDVTLLAAFEDEQLYRMQWIDHVHLLTQMISNAEATILTTYGADRTWYFRVLFPSRDRLSATHDFCERHNLTFDIEAVRELDGEPTGRYGLTDQQFEALVTAYEAGYFDVPRETTLEDLAADVGISHQALSERLRRGTAALIEDTLEIGPAERADE